MKKDVLKAYEKSRMWEGCENRAVGFLLMASSLGLVRVWSECVFWRLIEASGLFCLVGVFLIGAFKLFYGGE